MNYVLKLTKQRTIRFKLKSGADLLEEVAELLKDNNADAEEILEIKKIG